MTRDKLSEETIRRLSLPVVGNRVTYFAGAIIQGAKAPRGFGVRVTAAGARAFILNYRLRGREYRFTIGAWPDWPHSKLFVRRVTCASESTEGRTRLRTAHHHQVRRQ
jgi:hypothetical protein